MGSSEELPKKNAKKNFKSSKKEEGRLSCTVSLTMAVNKQTALAVWRKSRRWQSAAQEKGYKP